ncbi:hypothetical protein BKH43_00255 [Helicobacter sp. 13S00401-1]|uniref:hypothetical protein n=1 Tax=Helicobacter sp. 13S00401-1 TaxID=1905758 RepID=UPI000BA5A421|nr:hypothetical protein [Helicobacter sp. 13S00401-1]PAF51709.1 hypothetical protein BKH43_00255 [Helicobacter sp. 13S00401-1]
MDFSFFNKEKDSKESKVLVIGKDTQRLALIVEHLSLKGSSATSLKGDIFSLPPDSIPKNIQAVVVDCLTIDRDVEDYIDMICKLLPTSLPCVILGNNDSITIYQEFLKKNIFYLHFDSQLNLVYDQIANYQSLNAYAGFIKISVLGTKGGAGASSISYGLANNIYKRYKNKVLCVQGINSSFNLDLLSGRNFEVSDIKEEGLSLYRELKDEAYNFEAELFRKFNFVVFDHSVQSLNKDEIEHILNNSHSCVLVLDSTLSSIRKAKEVLRANNFLSSVNQGVKKLLICFNKAGMPSGDSLDALKIEELLESKLDLSLPYQSKLNEFKFSPSLKVQTALNEITNKLVGDIKPKGLKLFRRVK